MIFYASIRARFLGFYSRIIFSPVVLLNTAAAVR